jgi:ABC-type branched-subunit amino acid transport system substrate-binding protein
MRRLPLWNLFFSALIGLFCFCGAAITETPRDVVRIGVILPLTGGMAHVGARFRDAVRLAAEEISPQSRFTYQAIFEDDALLPANAATAAHSLINIHKVDALISTWSYGGTVVSPLAERAKVLHLGIAWDPSVALGKYNFLYLTSPSRFILKFFEGFKKKGYRRIAIVGWQESGSLFFLDEAQRLAPLYGFEIVKRVEFGRGDIDYRSAIMNLPKTQADVVILNLSAPPIDVFVKQMNELNVNVPITSITGFEVAADTAPLEGKWYVSDATPPDDFIEKFGKKYGQQQLYGVGNYYDALRMLVYLFEAAGKNGKPSPEQLLKQTAAIPQFPSIFGTVEIDADGIINYEPVFRKIVNGRRVTVGIDDL